jgi:ubiquinone/menaquinone biosynthesis C-methylase UbiE
VEIAAERKPHFSDDLASRRLKAIKIERLLDLGNIDRPIRMLEVGTGSGGIANYFGRHPTIRAEVDAVDVHDNRVVTDGYRFRQVTDTQLPYADRAFDIVISNHVIEHVGDRAAQMRHLAELKRVLATNGTGYLAVPNRWMVVEPHFHVAFLSWFPRSLRSRYLKLRGKGSFYDCEPLTQHELERMLDESALAGDNIGFDALRATVALEKDAGLLAASLAKLPDAALRPLSGLVPTLIYRFRHRVP